MKTPLVFYKKQIQRPLVTLLASFTLLTGLNVAVNPQSVEATTTGCNSNSVIYCGYSTPSNFITKVKDNNSGNGFRDLQAVFNSFGLESGDYTRFINTAKSGTVYKDGRIVVNGQTIGTAAVSWGRSRAVHDGAGLQTRAIGSTTLYGNSVSRTFISKDTFAAHVMFDSTGTPEFVVLPDCGNPVTGNFVKSGAVCNSLNATPVSGKPNTYSFTTNASKQGFATITKYVYDFGDGQQATVSSGTTPVTHTYQKAGNYTVRVTVHGTAPGGTSIVSTTAGCAKQIQIPDPVVQCVSLESAVLDRSKNSYTFTAKGSSVTGAKLVSADFDFGDGIRKTAVGAKDATTVVTSHEYEKEGSFIAKATLKYSIYDGAWMKTASACQTTVSVIVPFYECVELKGPEPDGMTYTFVATAKYGNGAEFISADFDFGDGNTVTGVKPNGEKVSTKHTYAKAAEYSVTAILRFDVNGKTVMAKACRALVKPEQPPVPECKPGIPVGDVRCTPCEYDANLPANDERCVAPAVTELPNTGAGNIVALSMAALLGGFLYYRHQLFKKHKREYLAAEGAGLPLPLADPLVAKNPLTGTPYELHSNKRNFFRRRQY